MEDMHIHLKEAIYNQELFDIYIKKCIDCGIKKAVKESKVDSGRYERFCKIYNELKEREERKW